MIAAIKSHVTNKLKRRLMDASLRVLEDELHAKIEAYPWLRLYQYDRMILNSHHQWGSKFLVDRLIKQGRVTSFIDKQTFNHAFPVYVSTESDGIAS